MKKRKQIVDNYGYLLVANMLADTNQFSYVHLPPRKKGMAKLFRDMKDANITKPQVAG